ncbi:MAG: hypothetical protein LUH10_10575 [Tannerellaceae bacterium]|nr:hypothetical protein [Tannerellaceae bacterium]
MKKLLVAFTLCIFTISVLHAQKENSYFFDGFQDAQVVYKDGRIYEVKVNYDFVANTFLFIDTTDNNEIKEFFDPENMAVVRVGERAFRPASSGATEILQAEPPLLVQYKGRVRPQDKKTAYGGTSATTAVESIGSISAAGQRYTLEGNGVILSEVSKRFIIEQGNKKKNFANEKQYLKIFSDKQQELKKYIQENNIDFNNIPDVINLYNYTLSL